MGEVARRVEIASAVGDAPLVVDILEKPAFKLSEMARSLNHLQANSNKYTGCNNNRSRIFKTSEIESDLVMCKVGDIYGVLSRYKNDCFILNYLNYDMNNEVEEANEKFELNLTKWQEKIRLDPQLRNSIKLNMKPPKMSSVTTTNPTLINNNLSPMKELIDPFDYFLEKYFSNLYNLTTPLTYFTKSNFTRLKEICKKNNQQYESILKQFILDLKQFDERHFNFNNCILNNGNLFFEKENIYRVNFIKNSLNLIDSVNDEKSYKNVFNNLKIREIQLQIILLLELVYISKTDELKNLTQEVKKLKTTTKFSIRNKNKNKNNKPEKSLEKKVKKLTYAQLLSVYIDKLCIWDSIMNVASKHDHSTNKFIKYIVIPFYEKKCPVSVKYLISKIKGPSFKFNIKRSAPTPDPEVNPMISKKKKEVKKIPDLSRNNSDLQQNLKRTVSFNSNLLLSKRQVDISIPVPKPVEEKKQPSFIFNRVGRKTTESLNIINSQSGTESHKEKEITQVEVTPIKPIKTVDVLQTPQDELIETLSSPIDLVVTSPINLKTTNNVKRVLFPPK